MNARSNTMSNRDRNEEKKKPETKWKFGENAKHEKLTLNCIRILDGTFEAGKTERKEKPLFNIQRGMLHFLRLEKGILACEKLISHQLVQAV